MNTAGEWSAFLVSITVLLVFLGKVIQLGYRQVRNHEKTQELVSRLAESFDAHVRSFTAAVNRIEAVERTLNNGIRAEIRQAIEEASEAKQEAIDAKRAVAALSAEVDIYTNVVLDDRRRIYDKVREATGVDLRDDGT